MRLPPTHSITLETQEWALFPLSPQSSNQLTEPVDSTYSRALENSSFISAQDLCIHLHRSGGKGIPKHKMAPPLSFPQAFPWSNQSIHHVCKSLYNVDHQLLHWPQFLCFSHSVLWSLKLLGVFWMSPFLTPRLHKSIISSQRHHRQTLLITGNPSTHTGLLNPT